MRRTCRAEGMQLVEGATWMLTCREATALASDSVDGTLSGARRLSYWMHLALCAACRRYRAQMDLTRAVLRRLASQAAPETPKFVRDELERMRKESRRMSPRCR